MTTTAAAAAAATGMCGLSGGLGLGRSGGLLTELVVVVVGIRTRDGGAEARGVGVGGREARANPIRSWP